MFGKDNDQSKPVVYDSNTAVGDFPWEEASFGATHSYNTLSMTTMTNPFEQIMDSSLDGRPEAVVESQTDGNASVAQLAKDENAENEYSGGTSETSDTEVQAAEEIMASGSLERLVYGTGYLVLVGIVSYWVLSDRKTE